MKNTIEIPAPKSVGLILSYRCTAKCAHCMYSCGPEWEEKLILSDRLRRTLSTLSEHIVPSPGGPNSIGLNHGLHLTGGEPFLHYGKLLEATRVAGELGIPSVFVETNSFWCSDDETTRGKLEELRRAGLDGIMISVNPFYLEFVPLENAKRAVRIGREVFGTNAVVYQEEYLRKFDRMGVEGKLDLEDYVNSQGGSLGGNVEFFLSGRAPYEVPQYGISNLEPRPPEWWFGGSCRPPFRREWHNHVDNYGNYMPGYCGGLTFGDIEEVGSLISRGLDRNDYPILDLLVENDLGGLYELARDHGYRDSEPGYYSRCHLCLDLRAFLHERGEFSELKPDEFYRRIPVKY